MIYYKEAYKYYTGEMVFTYTGDVWFMIDQYDNQKEINSVDMDKVAFRIK
jgi:hypothetical protein